jgi:heat-inducible transcriptional repressor
MLSDRKMKILKSIIDDYILTGIPVGSRSLSKKPDLDFSPATIRNEMADLEDMGYLDKPHTSAGRMPSDIAYRLYVDRLMDTNQISSQEASSIRNYFNLKMNELEQVIDMTARVLSDLTHHVSLVMAPHMEAIKVRRIQIVKLTENKALLIIITDSGIIKDTVIPVSREVEDEYMNMLSNALTQNTANKTLGEAAKIIREVCAAELGQHRELINEVFSAVSENKDRKDIVMGGMKNILDYPEYSDTKKARELLQLLETKDMLYDMLDVQGDLEFSIKIGSENTFEEFRNMSVVTATYRVGEQKMGSFGIIGPTRMDYGKVISVLNYVGMSLNEILSCFLEDGNKK